MTELIIGCIVILVCYAVYMYPEFLLWVLDRTDRNTGRV